MTKLTDITPKYHEKDPEYNIRGYIDYMNGVLDGTIVANEYITLACKRMKEWFSRDDIYFDVDDVDSRINFIWKLKHTQSPWTGKHFRLLPWQQFCIANIYGWKFNESHIRVTKNVFIMISRKNGKSSLAAALALCNVICDKEMSAQINLVANSAKQAHLCFDYMLDYAESVDPKKKVFQTYRSEIRVPQFKSKIQVLCADDRKNDGYNSSMVIFDELHAAKNFDLYDVMKTSQGSRLQPLMITITTAGFLVGDSYPCYSIWQTCIGILRGDLKDDSQFSAIYQLDHDDDWENENVWLKCCPSLGESVFIREVRDNLQSALNNASREVPVRTKIFNEWCQSSDVWLSHNLIKSNMTQMTVEEMSNLPNVSYGYIGVDLSAVSDLTALSLMVESEGKFYFKSWAFVPEDCLLSGTNSLKYREWAQQKYLDVTPGNVQDYDYILNKIIEIDKIIPLAGIYYDTWNAVQFAVNATNIGLPMYPYSQALGNFNRPTKCLELLLKSGKVVIDLNSVVLWCFANSTLKYDFNDNCKPIKADTKNGKIDTVIAMLQALGGYYLDNNFTQDLTAV